MTRQGKVLFVGAGPSQAPAIQHALNLGYEPYAIDANPNALGFKYALGFNIGDIRDPDFIKVCAQHYNVDAIVAVATDVSVPSVARACLSLGLPSVSVSAADISVNKLMQRNQFESAGLRVPKFIPFWDVNKAHEFAIEIGFPVVIKPSDASGSRGVSLVKNKCDVIFASGRALEASHSRTGIIEEFIDGHEISVEGFVINGSFHAICFSEKKRTPPPYLLDTDVYFPDSLDQAERSSILNIASRALAACGLDNCPVHMEILRSNQGPVVVELAARGAGFRVFTNILPWVTGVDTIDIQLKLAMGKKVEIILREELRGAVIAFLPPVPGKLKCVEGLHLAREIPGIQEAEVYINAGVIMGELKCGADRIGHVIAFSENRQEAEMRTKQALSLIKFKVD
jgi:biotin carboxylase